MSIFTMHERCLKPVLNQSETWKSPYDVWTPKSKFQLRVSSSAIFTYFSFFIFQIFNANLENFNATIVFVYHHIGCVMGNITVWIIPMNHRKLVVSWLSLTPWPFKPLPGLFCLNIFIGCAQKKGWYNKPRIFSLPVSSYFQSLQLPPTWDGRRWVRFGPGDPHTPAALLSALQVSPLTPNFQTSYYFLPTRWYRWLLGLLLRFRLSPAVFL